MKCGISLGLRWSVFFAGNVSQNHRWAPWIKAEPGSWLMLSRSLSQLKSSNQGLSQPSLSSHFSFSLWTWIPVSPRILTQPFCCWKLNPLLLIFLLEIPELLSSLFQVSPASWKTIIPSPLGFCFLGWRNTIPSACFADSKSNQTARDVSLWAQSSSQPGALRLFSMNLSCRLLFPQQHKVHQEEGGIWIQLLLVSQQPEECELWDGFWEVLGG